MNEKIKKYAGVFKKGKTLCIIGLIGIGLIYFSTLGTDKSNKTKTEEKFDAETYAAKLEKDIKQIVVGISGSRDVTVAVTLESGAVYDYADETVTNKADKQGQNDRNSTVGEERKYITVTDSGGNEHAVTVSENMPQIRGVAIVYSGNPSYAESIKNAVTALLNITSKRVYISVKGG